MSKKRIEQKLDQLFTDLKEAENATDALPGQKHLQRSVRSVDVPPSTSPATRKRPIRSAGTTGTLPDTETLTEITSLESTTTLALPIQVDSENWGILEISNPTLERGWSNEEKILVKQVVDQLSLAMENARLFQQTRSRAEELAALNELGRALASELSLNQVLDEVYRGVSRLIDTTNFYIGLYDSAKQEVSFVLNATESEIDKEIVVLPANQGITGYIIQTCEVVLIKEGVSTWLEEHGMPHVGEPAQSWLGVPIILGEQVLGVMAVQNYRSSNSYDEHDRDIFIAIANQAAISIQNAQLFQTAQERAEEMASINRVIATVSGFLDIETSMEMVAEEVMRLLEAQYVSIAFTNKDTETLEWIASVPLKSANPSPIGIAIPFKDNGAMQQIVEHRMPLVIRDVPNTSLLGSMCMEMMADETQSVYLAPILLGFDVLGVFSLEFADSERVLSERETRLLETISIQTATAIQKVRLFEETNRNREQLTEALRIGRMGYFEYDMPTGIITITNEMFALVETTSEQEGGNRFPLRSILRKFVVKDDIRSILTSIQELFGNPEKGKLSQEARFRSKGGKIIWVENTYTIVRDERGEYTKIVGSSQDITERKQAEEQLLKFKLGIENTDSAVFITDINGNIQYINAGFTKIYGYTAEEALGKTPRIIKSGLIPTEQYTSFWGDLLSKHTISGEIINRTRDGRIIPIAATNSPILDERGEIIGFLAVHSDITERKQFEETLQRQNEYLSISAEIGRLITSTLDRDKLFGRAVSLIRDRFSFYHVSIFIIEETGFKAILESATGDAGIEMKRRNHYLAVGSQSIVGTVTQTGEYLVNNNTAIDPIHKINPLLPETRAEAAIPLRVGDRVMGAIDIQSERENAFNENDIAILQSLADQIAIAIDNARSYELAQQAVQEMRELDRIKSQFLANMSHELRTPLNSIIGFSRVILKGIDGPISELQQQDLNAIYNSGQHLLRLINDILDLSKIEAGKMELAFDDVNLAETITSVLPTISGLIKDKPIKLKHAIAEDLPIVRADPMRLRQVLINLLSNAAKFSEEGEIYVEAGIKANSNGQDEVLISVSDTGPGISSEDQAKLFQPFSQVDASLTRKTGGTGLGLSISRHLVELHGGRIGLHSTEGQGSTFYFTLPTPKIKEASMDYKELSGTKIILAIDDDAQVISLYERYLQPQGYQVIALTDPTQAKQRVKQLKPFAVTLDIMMPGRDGWLVLSDLKTDAETRDIPVIICSILEDEEKGFSLGATDYLVKPILEEDLINALNRLNNTGDIRDVLVIADDPEDLQLIGKILNQSTNYRVILAEGGQQGWQSLSSNPPHAVILDLFMSDMDGFSILGRLRTNPILRDIPVIVISGTDLTAEQQQQLAKFGQSLLKKSALNDTELFSMLDNALNRLSLKKGA